MKNKIKEKVLMELLFDKSLNNLPLIEIKKKAIELTQQKERADFLEKIKKMKEEGLRFGEVKELVENQISSNRKWILVEELDDLIKELENEK